MTGSQRAENRVNGRQRQKRAAAVKFFVKLICFVFWQQLIICLLLILNYYCLPEDLRCEKIKYLKKTNRMRCIRANITHTGTLYVCKVINGWRIFNNCLMSLITSMIWRIMQIDGGVKTVSGICIILGRFESWIRSFLMFIQNNSKFLASLAWISSDCFEPFSLLSNIWIDQPLMPSSDVNRVVILIGWLSKYSHNYA